jgi:hypothetical protein
MNFRSLLQFELNLKNKKELKFEFRHWAETRPRLAGKVAQWPAKAWVETWPAALLHRPYSLPEIGPIREHSRLRCVATPQHGSALWPWRACEQRDVAWPAVARRCSDHDVVLTSSTTEARSTSRARHRQRGLTREARRQKGAELTAVGWCYNEGGWVSDGSGQVHAHQTMVRD